MRKVERKSTKAILRFWNKLKHRKNARKKVEPITNESLASTRNYSHVEGTMSARSQRGTHDTPTTKRFRSPRITVRNRTAKPHITYDYDAAISQPDVPNLLDYKNIGRGVMVSGVPLRKKALKTRLKGRIISRKNFQKRSQEFKTKSLIQKNASPIKTYTRLPSRTNQKTMTSSSIFEKENYIGEKENITNNDTNNVEHLSNSLRVCTSFS